MLYFEFNLIFKIYLKVSAVSKGFACNLLIDLLLKWVLLVPQISFIFILRFVISKTLNVPHHILHGMSSNPVVAVIEKTLYDIEDSKIMTCDEYCSVLIVFQNFYETFRVALLALLSLLLTILIRCCIVLRRMLILKMVRWLKQVKAAWTTILAIIFWHFLII